MKDALGQERASVRGRELTIAALFLVMLGVGVWTVALPALNEDPEEKDAPTDTSTTPAATSKKSP